MMELGKRDLRTLARMREGGVVSFRDLLHLIEAAGFSLRRQRGSHRVYKHPLVSGALVVQPTGADAKKYQIQQVLDMLDEARLLDPEP